MADRTLGERLFEGASKAYRSIVGNEDLPLDKRIYMESVFDRRRDPITERSLNPEELEQLRALIVSRYDRIKPQLQQSVIEMRANAQQALREAAATKDPGMRAAHLKSYRNISAMMNGIKSFLQTGKLNPEVVDFAEVYDVPAYIRREDYANPFEINVDTGQSGTSSGRDTALGQTLGRFNYSVDPQGTITVKDVYDFGPGASILGGPPPRTQPISVGDLITPKRAAAKLGYKTLPEGKGRPVTIRVNSMAPKPKEQPNWFSRAASYLGF